MSTCYVVLALVLIGTVACGGGSPTAPQSPVSTWAWGRWEGQLSEPALAVLLQLAGGEEPLELRGGVRSDGMVGGAFRGRLSRREPPATLTFEFFDAPADPSRGCSYEIRGSGTIDRAIFNGTYTGVLRCEAGDPRPVQGRLTAEKRGA